MWTIRVLATSYAEAMMAFVSWAVKVNGATVLDADGNKLCFYVADVTQISFNAN